jgi:hypothetical protein
MALAQISLTPSSSNAITVSTLASSGDAGRQSDGGEGGDGLEQHGIQRKGRHAHQDQGGDGDDRGAQQNDRQCLTLGFQRDAPPKDRRVGIAADLRPHDKAQQEEGRDLDASGGAGAAAADEHERIGDSQRVRPHVADVE